jgi:hypothetical protein
LGFREPLGKLPIPKIERQLAGRSKPTRISAAFGEKSRQFRACATSLTLARQEDSEAVSHSRARSAERNCFGNCAQRRAGLIKALV